jgi:hypothetical protein
MHFYGLGSFHFVFIFWSFCFLVFKSKALKNVSKIEASISMNFNNFLYVK